MPGRQDKRNLTEHLKTTRKEPLHMKSTYAIPAALAVILMTLRSTSCKGPYELPYESIAGYVIGKETCNTDALQDYWLLDFTVYPNSQQVGDTLVLNGITYKNVLKMRRLEPAFQQVGKKVSVDYNSITPYKVSTADCTVASPVTYQLKEVFSIRQVEVR